MNESPTRSGYADRLRRLRDAVGALGGSGVAVAFSGGVDSSVLLHAATAALGDRAVAVIADSPSLPRDELEGARRTAAAIGARLEVLSTDELSRAGYVANDGLRCYWCRHTLFEQMGPWAREQGFGALAYGEITDDQLDDRPGRRAASEFAVLAPLAEAGFDKEDVRRYAREHGLDVAEKPASACLASRIPRGRTVTREGLLRVERAERAIAALGFRVLRVRDHGAEARVEVGADELERAQGIAHEIEGRLRELDFERVRLAAYRSPIAANANTPKG